MNDPSLKLLFTELERHLDDAAPQAPAPRDAEPTQPDLRIRERFVTQLVTVNRLANVAGLTAHIAHEINNVGMLLSGAIMGIEDAMRENRCPDEDIVRDLQHAFDLIVQHTRRLGELSRVPSSHTELADLRPIIADTLDMLRLTGRTKYVKVDVALPSAPVNLRINRSAVEQLLIDLVCNATEAIGENASAHSIRVSLGRRDGKVALTVEAAGPGISPEIASRLFEPFVTSKAPGRAAGLGLSAARQIAEGLGGTLRLEAAHLRGARFILEVPDPSQARAA